MIIEFFGLSGTGKTVIGRELSRMLKIEYINVDSFFEKIKYALFYFFTSPLKTTRLFFKTINESGLSFNLMRQKLFILFCMAIRNQKALGKGGNGVVILDEGMAEYGLTLFEKEINEEEVRKYLQKNTAFDILVILRTDSNERIRRMEQKTKIPRSHLGIDIGKWQLIQENNEKVFRRVFERYFDDRNFIEVDTTGKTINNSLNEICSVLKKYL